jgi:nuclear transport factor 2 (NTF2) superfamily protein
MAESRPPLPPFTLETAVQKVRMAEDARSFCRAARRSRLS